MISPADQAHMAQALRLAKRGLYSTSPNPRVGCVIVRDGVVVGEGWHQRAGEAHAEVHALQDAGAAARGATAYVTLEPCSHHGKTPPCADALIAAGVLVFIFSLGFYITPAILGGGKNLMIGNLIGLQFGQGRNWPLGSAISITLMLIVMVAGTLWIMVNLSVRMALPGMQ